MGRWRMMLGWSRRRFGGVFQVKERGTMLVGQGAMNRMLVDGNGCHVVDLALQTWIMIKLNRMTRLILSGRIPNMACSTNTMRSYQVSKSLPTNLLSRELKS